MAGRLRTAAGRYRWILLKNPAANMEVEWTAALRVVEQISPSKNSDFATVR
jgi:hypothetical protein